VNAKAEEWIGIKATGKTKKGLTPRGITAKEAQAIQEALDQEG
jgi:hypothetical protein